MDAAAARPSRPCCFAASCSKWVYLLLCDRALTQALSRETQQKREGVVSCGAEGVLRCGVWGEQAVREDGSADEVLGEALALAVKEAEEYREAGAVVKCACAQKPPKTPVLCAVPGCTRPAASPQRAC